MHKEVGKLYKSLRGLRQPNGLYIASTGNYYRQFCWLRDVFYQSLPELKTNPKNYEQTYHTLLDWFHKVEKKYKKFSFLIKHPNPKYSYRYLHARVTPNMEEVHEHWQNKQNDIYGEMFYGIALGEKAGLNIIRNDKDKEIINLMVKALEAIEYWHDNDSGLWEENEEMHASSIGACVSGLKALKEIGFDISDELINKGIESLNKLLPRESPSKEVDLALLTLIYPFGDVIDDAMKAIIVENVESMILRNNGVLRYIGDWYFNTCSSGGTIGSEAEWTFGLAYLGMYYTQKNNLDKAKHYLERILNLVEDGNVPELYFGGTDKPNENTPLGWAVAMTILLYEEILKHEPNYKAE